MPQLRVSASQYELFDEQCGRKWWFKYCIHLPERTRSFNIYGTVLHAVAERYLSADDQGYVNGKPVDLYPKGWTVTKDWDGNVTGEVNPKEASQIKFLITEAIKKGILHRAPGRQIEYEFERDLHPDIRIKGFIDVLLPTEVQDHKTTVSTRYAKSKKQLQNNIQLLSYANELQTLRDLAGEPRVPIKAKHNIFVHDRQRTDGRVLERSVEYTPERIDQHLKWMIETGLEMKSIRDLNISESEWEVLPDPDDKSDACNAYGGCPFRGICSKGETPARYRDRFERARLRAQQPEVEIPVKGAPMPRQSMADLLKGTSQSAPKPAAPAPAPTPPAATAAKPRHQGGPATPPKRTAPALPPPRVNPPAPETSASQPSPDVDLPPWYEPGCNACTNSTQPGFASNGKACRVCDVVRKRMDQHESAFYNARFENGAFLWDADESEPSAPVEPEVVSPEVVIPPAAPAAAQEPEPPAAAVPAKRRAGRPPGAKNKAKTAATATVAPPSEALALEAEVKPKTPTPRLMPSVKGFVLCIGCAPAKGPKDLREFADVFKDLQEELISDMGEQLKAETYYQADTFARRDLLAACAPQIAESLAGCWLVVRSADTPDAKVLLEALRPYAGMVIE